MSVRTPEPSLPQGGDEEEETTEEEDATHSYTQSDPCDGVQHALSSVLRVGRHIFQNLQLLGIHTFSILAVVVETFSMLSLPVIFPLLDRYTHYTYSFFAHPHGNNTGDILYVSNKLFNN